MLFKKKNWPGIKKNTLEKFKINLITNYNQTINNFLDLQKTRSTQCLKEVDFIKKILLSQPRPNIVTLENSFHALCTTDLLSKIKKLKTPLLKIYGSLDTLIPKTIIKKLDKKIPYTSSVVIDKAHHMPFISHKNTFCSIIDHFSKNFY